MLPEHSSCRLHVAFATASKSIARRRHLSWTPQSTPFQHFSMGEEINQNYPPSNTCLLGPTTPHTPNAISIQPAVSSRLTVTVAHPTPHATWDLDRSSRFCRVPNSFIPDRPTDRPTDHGNVSSNTPHRICYAYTMGRKNSSCSRHAPPCCILTSTGGQDIGPSPSAV